MFPLPPSGSQPDAPPEYDISRVLTSFADVFKPTDGLSILTEFYTKVVGRRLSASAFRALIFFHQHGSPHLAQLIISMKLYQVSPRDVVDMVKATSSANYAEQLMQAQAKARKD